MSDHQKVDAKWLASHIVNPRPDHPTVDAAYLAERRRLAEAATRGPWFWNLNRKSRQVQLEGKPAGRETVLAFARWGMNGAQPLFCRGGLLVDAHELAKPYPGREHHETWFANIDHPDAAFIADARTSVPVLVARVEELEAENARLRALTGGGA